MPAVTLVRPRNKLSAVLIIGAGPMGRMTGENLEREGIHRVIGYVPFAGEQVSHDVETVLGTAGQLEHILARVPVHEVYIAGNWLEQARAMREAMRVCQRVGVPFALPAFGYHLRPGSAARRSPRRHLYLHHRSQSKPGQLAVKRLLDIAVSAVALVLLLPLFALVAATIKAASRGPVFFTQVRLGQNGRPFRILKFRSMVVNAEALQADIASSNERAGPVFKMFADPRVTRIGAFLRKFSIDELPQLLCVLRGDMSLVGPRPAIPAEVACYEQWQLRRLCVRPGLTGSWQVRADRHAVPFSQWMKLVLQYIDQWSLGRDLALIWQTVPVVFMGKGQC